MSFQHIQARTLRDYLLRTLPEVDADAIERRYFEDASFFRKLRAAEIKLVCDYLDNQLSGEQLEKFKAHYLQVDTLKALVARVQQRRIAMQTRRRLVLIALASAVGCMALGIAFFRFHRSETAPTAGWVSSVTTVSPTITLTLMPGTSKGAGSQNHELTLSMQQQRILLALELPGQESVGVYTVQLRNADRVDGNNAWTRSGLRSTLVEGVRQVEVELPAGFVEPGDYILELEKEGATVKRTYQFRLTSPQK